jgi:hypothetical protein
MKVVSLYPSNDVYQAVDEEDKSVYFQGTEADCKRFIKKFKHAEKLKTEARQKVWRQTILHRNF